MGLIKFLVNRFLGEDEMFDDDDLDDEIDDDFDDDDLSEDMDDDAADDDDDMDDDADDADDVDQDDEDAEDDELDDELEALNEQVQQQGIMPSEAKKGQVSFGRKWCPTRHGCTGATNCDHAYGAPD